MHKNFQKATEILKHLILSNIIKSYVLFTKGKMDKKIINLMLNISFHSFQKYNKAYYRKCNRYLCKIA